MTTLLQRLRNPVLIREGTVRMRGWRAPILIALYVGVMGLLILGLMQLMTAGSGGGFAPEMGAVLFSFLAMVQLGLLLVATPGLTGGALAGERERQTLDLLLVTRLSAGEVVFGKLAAAVGFAGLLVMATLPLYGLLFLFGGVSLVALGRTLVVYAATLFFVGSIGILWSTVLKKTVAAIVTSYATVLFLTLGTGFIILLSFVFNRGSGPVAAWVAVPIWINPGIALAIAVGGPMGDLSRGFAPLFTTEASQKAIWWIYCLFALGLGALALWTAARRLARMTQQ
jgi:ABC-2 type transport system permease protein